MEETPKDNQSAAAPPTDPGTIITPAAQSTNVVAPPPAVQQPVPPQVVTPPPAPPSPPTTPVVTSEQPPQIVPASPPQLPETDSQESETALEMGDSQAISWTASEFHEHQKSATWYFLLIVITVVVAAILYFWTKSIVTTVVIALSGLVIGVYGARKPAALEYSVDSQGIRIGNKQYLYDDFKLFVVTPELSLPEITLIPVKRFMPSLSIRYSPEVGDRVMSMLGDHLPFEERRPDLIDSLMHKIHF